jgi:hypothetical protein
MAGQKPSKKILALGTKDNLIRIAAYARNGLSEEQIAKNLGVSLTTFFRAKKSEEVGEAIQQALIQTKEVVDFEVENMLRKRAMGYEYDEVKEEYEMGILIKRTVTKKVVPPDVSAQIFWLKNRKPTEWRDRREVDNTVALEKLDEVLGQIKGCE